MTTTQPSVYPVRVTGRLDQHLSRWLWLVKWLLVLPHVLVLALLWVGFVVLTAVAFVAIVFTGRYPRALFDYNVGVLRWTWRVAYYAYGTLGTDEYPPFTLRDVPDYAARLDVAYPEHLSRGLALVKWWLLALPHYLVVGVFVGGGTYAATRDDGTGGIGLIGLLVLFAGVALLVRGEYPRSLFDLVLGLNRWALRVAAYAGLMTDRYPPFRLDLGGSEPGAVTLPPSPSAPPTTAGPAGGNAGWTGGRITGTALGSVAVVLGLGLGAGGAALVVVDEVVRDSSGFVMTDREQFSTTTAAIVESDVELPVEGPSWFYGPEQLGTVRFEVTTAADAPVFLGIARRDEVTQLLRGTAYDEVSETEPDPSYTRVDGREQAPDPTAGTWAASRVGSGDLELTWRAAEGDWAVVAMNADGSPGVVVDVRAGATLPHLDDLALGLGAAGLVLLTGGALALTLSVRGAVRAS